jgi:hypothetical protein
MSALKAVTARTAITKGGESCRRAWSAFLA